MFNDTTPAILYRNRCYLLHFYNPATGESAKLAHAAHYLGMSDSVSERLAQHGTSHGESSLMQRARLAYPGLWRRRGQVAGALKNASNRNTMARACARFAEVRYRLLKFYRSSRHHAPAFLEEGSR
jgi:hypothetical protein